MIIRVYNRVEDLKHCINIIRDTWKLFNYHIVVVANGGSDGFVIDEDCKSKIDRLVDLETNAGHLKGNAQLLQEGLLYIPGDCTYTLILEADNWLYGDQLMERYVTLLNEEKAVWASAQWYSHLYSLATDIAIIQTGFLTSNPQIFEYTGYPECYAANYIIDNSFKFIYITENMPVHLPGYIKYYPFMSRSRFNVFPESKMVTHHVELLNGGMEKKKLLFNTLAATSYFKGDDLKPNKLLKLKMLIAIKLSFMFPIKGWIMKSRQLKIEKF